MRIGIDFDNTIAAYDHVFLKTAKEWNLLPPAFAGAKTQIRDTIRKAKNGELAWQKLQGEVYGSRILEATLIDGVAPFLKACRKKHLPVFIISHKTKFGHHQHQGANLHDAALSWMKKQDFFSPDGFAIPPKNVYFEPTKEDKISRISKLSCSHFIDDLEDILLDDSFPPGVRRFLFGPSVSAQSDAPLEAFNSWNGITETILDT